MDQLYFFGGAIVMGLIGLYFRNKRMRNILKQRGYDDDNCASCGSTQVTKISETIYTCPRCGHEGGSGRRGFGS